MIRSFLNYPIANTEDGEGDAGGADSITVIDIVDAFSLKEIELKKAGWGALVKAYMPKVKAHLEANGKADRVASFMKGATAMCKEINAKFDEIQIFCGTSYDMDCALCYCYYVNQDDNGPTFFFFVDGLKDEKV